MSPVALGERAGHDLCFVFRVTSRPPERDPKRSVIPRNLIRALAEAGISGPRVVAAIDAVPREPFGLDTLWEPPDSDSRVARESRSTPAAQVTARMVQALDLEGHERVLDIGTGSGYRAALLSRLARDVYSVESDPARADSARRTLGELGYTNVRVVDGDGSDGWAAASPYQAIVVGGAVLEVPQALLQELDEGGRLVVPIGSRDAQLVVRFCKRRQALDSETVTWSALEPLVSRAAARTSRYPWVSSSSTQPPSSEEREERRKH